MISLERKYGIWNMDVTGVEEEVENDAVYRIATCKRHIRLYLSTVPP
jgi:hypothetical protein